MKKAISVALLFVGLGGAGLHAQDVTKARALLEQAMAALAPTPLAPVAIATPADFDVAVLKAAPGATLTLSRSLVYPSALTITKSLILVAEGDLSPARMDATTPLPSFRNGIVISADDVVLTGVEVKKADPLTDVLVFTAANVTIDRVRVLGDPVRGAKRGIRANGNGNAKIVKSYVQDAFQSYPGNDSQAICAWDMAPGLLIEDNYLSGGSETVMIGGADASSPERMPRHIIIRGNTITKRPEWQSMAVGVKNTLELKAAADVLIENNDISYSWGGHGQDGYLLLMTVRNQDGSAPWSTVQDVTVTGNRFSHGAGAINLLGLDNIKETRAAMPAAVGAVRSSVRMARVNISNNTFADIDPTLYTGSNRLILIGAGPEAVTIDQNTFAGQHLGAQVYFYGVPAAQGLVVTNNMWPSATYGIKGDGAASGASTWTTYVNGGQFAGNVVRE